MGSAPEEVNKVIIFDWDDTICPSSFVDQWKVDTFSDLPLHFQNMFNEVGKCAEKCLDAAAEFGEVCANMHSTYNEVISGVFLTCSFVNHTGNHYNKF